jgi:hypothetical protein
MQIKGFIDQLLMNYCLSKFKDNFSNQLVVLVAIRQLWSVTCVDVSFRELVSAVRCSVPQTAKWDMKRLVSSDDFKIKRFNWVHHSRFSMKQS